MSATNITLKYEGHDEENTDPYQTRSLGKDKSTSMLRPSRL